MKVLGLADARLAPLVVGFLACRVALISLLLRLRALLNAKYVGSLCFGKCGAVFSSLESLKLTENLNSKKKH